MTTPERRTTPAGEGEGHGYRNRQDTTSSVTAEADITQLLRNAYRSLDLTTITTATAVLHALTVAAMAVLVVIA